MVIAGGIEANQETAQAALSLEKVIALTIPPLLRQCHLNRDVIIGLIGPRGGGKSLAAAILAALDYGIEGDTLRSNMQISWNIVVSEEQAILFGLNPGSVRYESQELDKHKFLNFHSDYFQAVYVIEEINVWLADARRSMAQQNLLADDVTQQIRKEESPIYYTCIHEMFVDGRIRDMTDLFIKTEDTALTESGLRNKQRQGIKFQWMLYPMSKKFTGHTYQETHQPLGPIGINGEMLWGIMDTRARQERKKYKPEETGEEWPVQVQGDPAVFEEYSRWGWLYERILALHQNGIPELEDETLWRYLQIEERGLTSNVVGRQLKQMGIINKAGRQGHRVYEIDGFDLKNIKDVKEMALVKA